MKHLGIAEVIKFHLVFDDFLLKGSYYDVFEAIRAEILDDYKNLMARFYFDEDSDEAIKMALIKLARSDRKKFSVNKILPQSMTNRVYAKLFSKDFLVLEKSQEKPRVKNKRQILKKSERAYKIEDKIHFNSHFSRREFDEYASLGFELLSGELMAKKLGFNGILLSSFWSKNIELDMLFSINGKIIVGEAKYKERKICKNVLNLVLHKCERLGIKPDIVALFSKSGFSNELLGLKDERLRLYEIKDYEELL